MGKHVAELGNIDTLRVLRGYDPWPIAKCEGSVSCPFCYPEEYARGHAKHRREQYDSMKRMTTTLASFAECYGVRARMIEDDKK